jgi:hypothetical protein
MLSKTNNKNNSNTYLFPLAYKLFSDRNTPLEVAIALNLRESEATKFYKEYWKLKQSHNLNMIYEETKGDVTPFLRLYKLSKAKGMGVNQVVNVLEIANEDLPDIQCRYDRLKREVNTLEFNKQQSHIALSYYNNQTEMKSKALTSYHISCIRQRREIEKLYNEKVRLEALITGFKSNDEQYLKIKQISEEKVKDVLNDGKLLLKIATLSVIESLRMNSELYNFISNGASVVTASTTTTTYGSNYPPLMLSGRQHQEQQSFIDSYTALVLEESEKLYNQLTTELTNRVMVAAAAASIRATPLP